MSEASSTSASPSGSAPLALPPRQGSRKWTTAALLLLMVLASMESTVTSTVMPTIIGHLQGLNHYSWVAAIYLLASTATMPIYGRLADRLGRKRVLLAALVVFMVGSVMASFSRSMDQLILFRGIQGLGAGGIMPVVLTILADIFTLQERAKIQGIFSAVWGSAAVGGPALGAFLLTTENLGGYVPQVIRPFLGWPSIFWVNLPAGLAGAVVLIFKYHDYHHHHAQKAEEPGEAAAGGSTMKVLMSAHIFPCLVISALMGIAVMALDTYVPLYVQGGRGMSAAAAAATVTPVMLAWASSGIFAAPLLLWWGYRRLAFLGSLLGTLGFVGLLVAVIMQGWLGAIIGSLFVTGMGFGPASMATLLGAQNRVGYRYRGSVTAAITFSRNLGGAIGVTALGFLFNALTAAKLAQFGGHFAASELLDQKRLDEVRSLYPDELRSGQATIANGLFWVFVTMLAAACGQTLISLALPAKDKADHKPSVAESLEAIAG